MRMPVKGGEVEVPQEWIDLWNSIYYDVPRAIQEAVVWAHDNPGKQKTKRGARAFLGNWIRRSCAKRPPSIQMRAIVEKRDAEILSREERQAHLDKLKAALK